MNEMQLKTFKSQMETTLRRLLTEALQSAIAQQIPEMLQGLSVITAAGDFCQGMKDDYPRLKSEFVRINQDIGLTEFEHKRIIDEVTSKVLDEFIEPNPKDDYGY